MMAKEKRDRIQRKRERENDRNVKREINSNRYADLEVECMVYFISHQV